MFWLREDFFFLRFNDSKTTVLTWSPELLLDEDKDPKIISIRWPNHSLINAFNKYFLKTYFFL